jgi:predicted N-acyltransferase
MFIDAFYNGAENKVSRSKNGEIVKKYGSIANFHFEVFIANYYRGIDYIVREKIDYYRTKT